MIATYISIVADLRKLRVLRQQLPVYGGQTLVFSLVIAASAVQC